MSPFVIILFAALSDTVLATNDNMHLVKTYYNVDDAENIFNKYIEEYDKFYPDKSEYATRLEIFKDRLKNINKWNAMYPLTLFGINQFSDHATEEFRQKYTGLIGDTNRNEESLVDYVPTGISPDELDYRKQGLVTEVKFQGTCGSCYVFSAIGNVEGQYAKKYGNLVSLSEQQCLDCHWESSGCKGGWMHETMKALASQGGSMTEQDYPYDGGDYTINGCKYDNSKIVAEVADGIKYNVTDEENLKDALASIGPLSIGIFSSDQFASYIGGIFTAPCDPNEQSVNHGVLLVGYGSEGGVDYWIIKNSWGISWGEQGYIRFLRGQNLCLIGDYVATATIA